MHMKICMCVYIFFSGRCDMDANSTADAASTTSTTHSKSCHYRRSFRLTDLDLDDRSRGLQKGESVVLDAVAVDRRNPRAGSMQMTIVAMERPQLFVLVVLLPSWDRRTSPACRCGRRRRVRSDTTDWPQTATTLIQKTKKNRKKQETTSVLVEPTDSSTPLHRRWTTVPGRPQVHSEPYVPSGTQDGTV